MSRIGVDGFEAGRAMRGDWLLLCALRDGESADDLGEEERDRRLENGMKKEREGGNVQGCV